MHTVKLFIASGTEHRFWERGGANLSEILIRKKKDNLFCPKSSIFFLGGGVVENIKVHNPWIIRTPFPFHAMSLGIIFSHML